MKKLKKPLSIILAVIMAISVCAVGFSAFAATSDVEKQIESAKELTDTLKNAYNTLTPEEKDAMKPANQAKIQNLAYAKAEKNAEGKKLNKTARMEAARELIPLTEKQLAVANMAAVLSGNASFQVGDVVYHRDVMYKIKSTTFKDKLEINVKTADGEGGTSKVTVTVDEQKAIFAELLKQYEALNDTQKDLTAFYTSGWNTSANTSSTIYGDKYTTFMYVSSLTPNWGNSTSTLLTLSANKIKIEAAKEPTATELETQVVAAVQNVLSAEGKVALAAICSMAASLTALISVDNPTIEQINTYVKAADEFAKLLEDTTSVITAACGSMALFVNESGKSTTPLAVKSHVNSKNTTIDFEKFMLSIKIPTTGDKAAAELADEVAKKYDKISYGNKKYISKGALEKKEAVDKKAAEYRINVFKDYVWSIDVPADDFKGSAEFNKTLTALSAEFDALDATTKASVKANEEIIGRMKKLFSFSQFNKTEDVHEIFEPVTVETEAGNLLESVLTTTVVPDLNNFVDYLLGALVGSTDVNGVLSAFFTNENVTAALKMLYPMLEEAIGAGTFRTSPKDVATYLPNTDQFKDAKQVLENAANNSWDNVPADLEWNVLPGDYDTFINALLNALNPLAEGSLLGGYAGGYLVKSFVLEKLPNEYESYADGSNDYSQTTFGAWDYAIVPLFEALGITNVISSTEYTEKVAASEGNLADYVRPLIDELYHKVIPTILAAPADWLLTNLPNFLYHFQDNCILEGIWKWLDPALSMVKSFAKLDVKQMLADLLAVDGVAPDEINGDAILKFLVYTINNAGVDLSYDDLMTIAHIGTPKAMPTQREQYDSIVRVEADKESLISYLAVFVNDLLKNIDLGGGIKLDFTPRDVTFVKQEAPKYPHNGKMDKKVMNAMITGLDDLLSGFININDLINNGLCTNVMAADAITGIYGALEGILGAAVSPSVVSIFLTEDIYKDVVKALQVPAWSDVALVVKNGDSVYSCVDMGFKDGDRDGFINCLVAALRPLVGAISEMGLLPNTTATDGSTIYGLYETLIIPLFEALGITPAVNSTAYTDNYNKLLKRANPDAAYDYALKTILDPILDLVNQVTAAPVATLMKLLPNLAYAIQYNPTLAFLGNLLDSMGGLTGILNGLVQGIATGEDAAGNPVYGLKNLELPAIDLNALASCGKVTDKDSKSALHKTYTTVVADSADTFVTVFYYLHEAINYKENLNTIKDLLAGIEGIDPSISTMIGTILNDVFTQSREEALCSLGTLLASDIWECPNGDGNNGDGTPSTGDSSIPAAVVLLMMVSAGGAILLLKKKKPVTVK